MMCVEISVSLCRGGLAPTASLAQLRAPETGAHAGSLRRSAPAESDQDR